MRFGFDVVIDVAGLAFFSRQPTLNLLDEVKRMHFQSLKLWMTGIGGFVEYKFFD